MKNAINITILFCLFILSGKEVIAQAADSNNQPCMKCDSLKYLRLPDVKINEVISRPAKDWVENGPPPDRIVLSRMQNGSMTMTRPVFPYPRKAVYDGVGDPNVETSFK